MVIAVRLLHTCARSCCLLRLYLFCLIRNVTLTRTGLTGRGPLIALISKRTYLGKRERDVLHRFVLFLAENVKVILIICPRSVSPTLGFTLEVKDKRFQRNDDARESCFVTLIQNIIKFYVKVKIISINICIDTNWRCRFKIKKIQIWILKSSQT